MITLKVNDQAQPVKLTDSQVYLGNGGPTLAEALADLVPPSPYEEEEDEIRPEKTDYTTTEERLSFNTKPNFAKLYITCSEFTQSSFSSKFRRANYGDAAVTVKLDQTTKFGNLIFVINEKIAVDAGLKEIGRQGNDIMTKPGVKVKITNSKGKSLKLKFGHMIESSSFHLKAFTTDRAHCRNLGAYNLYRDMLKLTKYPDCEVKNTKARTSYASDELYKDELFTYDSAYVSLGFPVALYINKGSYDANSKYDFSKYEFYGLYTLLLLKTATNYGMNEGDEGPDSKDPTAAYKGNANHIFADGDIGGSMSIMSWNPSYWEIKSPTTAAFASDVDSKIRRLYTYLAKFKEGTFSSSNISTLKSEASSYLNVKSWILLIILAELIMHGDSVANNYELASWDGEHWSLLPWDFDTTAGVRNTTFDYANAKFADVPASFIYNESTASFYMNTGVTSPSADATGAQFAGGSHNLYDGTNAERKWWNNFKRTFYDDICSTYAILRNSGLFNIGNILQHYKDVVKYIPKSVYHDDLAKHSLNLGGYVTDYGTLFPGLDRIGFVLNRRIKWLDKVLNYVPSLITTEPDDPVVPETPSGNDTVTLNLSGLTTLDGSFQGTTSNPKFYKDETFGSNSGKTWSGECVIIDLSSYVGKSLTVTSSDSSFYKMGLLATNNPTSNSTPIATCLFKNADGLSSSNTLKVSSISSTNKYLILVIWEGETLGGKTEVKNSTTINKYTVTIGGVSGTEPTPSNPTNGSSSISVNKDFSLGTRSFTYTLNGKSVTDTFYVRPGTFLGLTSPTPFYFYNMSTSSGTFSGTHIMLDLSNYVGGSLTVNFTGPYQCKAALFKTLDLVSKSTTVGDYIFGEWSSSLGKTEYPKGKTLSVSSISSSYKYLMIVLEDSWANLSNGTADGKTTMDLSKYTVTITGGSTTPVNPDPLPETPSSGTFEGNPTIQGSVVVKTSDGAILSNGDMHLGYILRTSPYTFLSKYTNSGDSYGRSGAYYLFNIEAYQGKTLTLTSIYNFRLNGDTSTTHTLEFTFLTSSSLSNGNNSPVTGSWYNNKSLGFSCTIPSNAKYLYTAFFAYDIEGDNAKYPYYSDAVFTISSQSVSPDPVVSGNTIKIDDYATVVGWSSSEIVKQSGFITKVNTKNDTYSYNYWIHPYNDANNSGRVLMIPVSGVNNIKLESRVDGNVNSGWGEIVEYAFLKGSLMQPVAAFNSNKATFVNDSLKNTINNDTGHNGNVDNTLTFNLSVPSGSTYFYICYYKECTDDSTQKRKIAGAANITVTKVN